MKRPGYKEAVQWIADHDNGANHDHEEIAGYITSALVADIFGVPQEKVGRDVYKKRGGDPDFIIAGSHT